MKRIVIIAAGIFSASLGLIGCGGAKGNDPGSAYMPDMYYARAYETYNYNNVEGELDSLRNRGILYNGLPVSGTVARGDVMPHHLTGDSAGLRAAETMRNPLDSMASTRGAMKEAERLYLINCGICHGPALDGNGPITEAGGGGYPAVPPSLKDGLVGAMSDGHYFHVITFGKGSMGSYASQLTPDQRWWVIKYIRSRQAGNAAKSDSTQAGGAGTNAAATGDTTNTK